MTTDIEIVGGLPLAEIEQITVPVTLLYCQSSAFDDTFDTSASTCPTSDPVLMPRTEWGHFGPLEQPDAVADGGAACARP